MKIRYNAPVTLNLALISTVVLVLGHTLGLNQIYNYVSVPGRFGFDASEPLHYVRLFTHILGHADWSHLLGNFSFILLLGPILEEKYSSVSLLIMILFTAFITGILNILLFNTGLLGASGIVFMMILLVSFTNVRNGEIPITFFLIIALYLAKEIIGIMENNDISEFAHIVGGLCGSLFGFFQPKRVKN